MLTVKANQKTLHRQIRSQFQGKRKIPFVGTDQEVGHGRDITWTLRAKQAPAHISDAWIGTSLIVEVTASSTRVGKPFQASHLSRFTRRTNGCDTILRTTPEALMQLVCNRWSIEAGTESVTPSSMRMPTAIGAMAPA